MEERGYVAEALLERLRAEGIAYRLIGDPGELPEHAPEELELAIPRHVLGELPRLIARFGQDFDLRLVELYRPGRSAWRAVVAWSDEVGRPRFMAARFFVGAEEGATPDALFICGLVDAVEKGALSDSRASWLSRLWHEEPHAALERVGERWRNEQERRLVANAARSGNWQAVRTHMKDLRGFRLIDPRDLMQRHAVLGAERRVVDAARTLGGELGGERQHRGDRGPRRQQCLQCRQAFGVKTNPRKFHRR